MYVLCALHWRTTAFYEMTTNCKYKISCLFPESKQTAMWSCSYWSRWEAWICNKSFFKFTRRENPRYIYACERILQIPTKKCPTPVLQYLSYEEIKEMLEKPNPCTEKGFEICLYSVCSMTQGQEFPNFWIWPLETYISDGMRVYNLRGKGINPERYRFQQKQRICLKIISKGKTYPVQKNKLNS